ncbi:MAG: trypsin-like peptidase domain-containing protein [Phycisphaerales bacterium]|jgi:Do/DeqQ family serine protease
MSIRMSVLCVAIAMAATALAIALLPSQAGQIRKTSLQDAGLVFADRGDEQPELSDKMEADVAFAGRLSRVFRHASQTIEPSVIHIQTARRISRAVPDRFGRLTRQEQTLPAGVGSGVIVTADGYALTNHHVVQGADVVLVTLADGREVEAAIVGSDPGTDLAVLRLNASGLTPATIADSDALQVGDWVVAVGSPFGLDHTVTAGIVSAKGRSGLTPRVASRQRVDRFEEFIQTDAAINPGNSGGPLVNLHGELVGINSMIASSGGGSVGIGFAIPSAIAISVFDNLRETGRLEQGFLGVSDLVNTSDIAAEIGQELPEGVYVQTVIEGGPADRAGILEGDIIASINGRRTENFNRLRNLVGLTRPGTEIVLEIIRDGQIIEKSATVADGEQLRQLALREQHQAERRALEQAIEDHAQSVETLGVQGLTIDDQVPMLFPGMPSEGVLVIDVEPETPASALSITRGDVILGINNREVRTVEQLIAIMERADLASGVRVEFVSGGRRQSAVVRLRS